MKAAVITAIIFALGLSLGWYLEYSRVQAIRGELEALKIQADEARVGLAFFNAFKDDPNFCEVFASEVNAQLARVGALGAQLEKLREANKLDESYYSLKKQYVLFNAELWIRASEFKKLCNASVSTIIYFYPEAHCADCARQASELMSLKRACPDAVWLFALPTDLNISVVSMLAQKFGVAQTPSLVVDREMLGGFHSLDELRTRFPSLAKCV